MMFLLALCFFSLLAFKLSLSLGLCLALRFFALLTLKFCLP